MCVVFQSVCDRVLEKTSLREKLAKYSAAVSKQSNTKSVSKKMASSPVIGHGAIALECP